MASEMRNRFPNVKVITGDCQARLHFEDGFFDRYIAIHVLEHLPDLPSCVREAHRLLSKDRGQMLVVIPCEGGAAYSLARKISAERVYNRHFKGGYGWFIAREHLNRPHEILAELDPYFTVEKKVLFPLPFLPFIFSNLCIGLVLKPRPSLPCPRSEQ
jgi:SAM-dependent methyltransferase